MWEGSLEKLKLLNYEKDYCKRYNRKPFSQVHFAIPGINASHQLDDFTTICSWLCTEITGKADTFKPDAKDDPNTVINKLLLALRQLEFRSSFPPQKLKVPHGEPVCTVLDFLTDKAIATRGFQWAQPVHISVDDVEQAQGNEDEEEDVIEDDAHNEPE
jgi:estrogen-related receptor beta like 1